VPSTTRAIEVAGGVPNVMSIEQLVVVGEVGGRPGVRGEARLQARQRRRVGRLGGLRAAGEHRDGAAVVGARRPARRGPPT
jgi:hypothetical protein